MSIYLITSSENKYIEAKEVIPELERKDFDLLEIQSLDAKEIIREKLKEAKGKIKGDILVEDVSMELEAFNSFPGPFVKWMKQTTGIDAVSRICIAEKKTNVDVICYIGLFHEGKEYFFEGRAKGTIVEPRGSREFGFDPIFQPEGSDKTFAEMTKEEKQKYSHRGKAYQALKTFLQVRNRQK
jgi:non-canonical purine NTP pyrophosphatase (RdgB/HAM1 family)